MKRIWGIRHLRWWLARRRYRRLIQQMVWWDAYRMIDKLDAIWQGEA
jgi:hypothetical protein